MVEVISQATIVATIDCAWGLAGRLAANAPLTMKGHKRTLAALSPRLQLPPGETEEIGFLVTEAMNSEDASEGIAAVLEKRPPTSRGNRWGQTP